MPGEKADEAAALILEHAGTGLPGDNVLKIMTRERFRCRRTRKLTRRDMRRRTSFTVRKDC